jgi:hypothetical protein
MIEPTGLGLAPPSTSLPPGMVGAAAFTPAPQQLNVGGIMSMQSLGSMQSQETNAAALERANTASADPVMQSLAAHIRKCWSANKRAKLDIEQQMLEAVRARRGEYEPSKLSEIQAQGGSEIYMMIFATKARQSKALLTDVLLGTGAEKPWTISPSPKPELPPSEVTAITQALYQEVLQAEMGGQPMAMSDVRQKMADAREMLESRVMEDARRFADIAETSIEDTLVEGGWLQALDEFIDDLSTFKTAFLKGPIIRREPRLAWSTDPATGKNTPVVEVKPRVVYERVDPFKMYPSASAKDINDGDLIELHNLDRSALSAMIGVDGYNEDAIRAVLDAHGTGGLREWLAIDVQQAQAEGRDTVSALIHTETIDALQFWGSASGKMLREWGMTKQEVPDEAKEYEIEAWMVGTWVIKAVINSDPLHRRNYFADGYSRVSGAFWHDSLYDLIKDVCSMANASARALSNNMGMASGPQVGINIDRMATGEPLTQMFPWKMHQFVSDPMGSSAAPIIFFQPESHAQELMSVFDKFSVLADEYAGIPRYMAGIGGGEGGAGRTASGMSMMIGNASKQTKQILASLDLRVISPSVERTYDHKMQYEDDPDLKGDLNIVARGALSLVTRDAAQVRRNEFLQTTANPIDMQIIGLDGRAEVLRESAKGLNMDTDRIIPNRTILKQRAAAMQQQALAQQQQEAGAPAQQAPGAPPGNGQELMNGAPVTDHFSPTPSPT